MLDQQVPLIADPKSLLLERAQQRHVGDVLKLIVDRLAMSPAVALTRIWLVRPNEGCSSCPMPSQCEDQSSCLHLVASAGTSIVEPSTSIVEPSTSLSELTSSSGSSDSTRYHSHGAIKCPAAIRLDSSARRWPQIGALEQARIGKMKRPRQRFPSRAFRYSTCRPTAQRLRPRGRSGWCRTQGSC